MRYPLWIFCFLWAFSTEAQVQVKSPATYQSADDASLNLRSVVVVPFTDNMNGVYSAPLTQFMEEKIRNEHIWDVVDSKFNRVNEKFDGNLNQNPKIKSSQKLSNEHIDSSLSERASWFRLTKADAMITSKIIKGPRGISIRLNLYGGPQGQPLLQENFDQIQSFEMEELHKAYSTLWDRLRKRLPFNGNILSRRGSQVTINLGRLNGLGDSSTVSAILILKIERHPKLLHMVSTQKEILGKIQIDKVDDYLSFGSITYEKEAGLLKPGMKIQVDEPIPRSQPSTPAVAGADLAFGKNPQEWLPKAPPQYGKLSFALGITQYNQSAALTTVGTIQATNSFAPTLRLGGELWFNDEWQLNLMLRQSALSVSNSMNNSSPGTLNMSLSQQTLSAGYSLLINNQFFGPKFQFTAGLHQFSARIDQSTPLAFTTMNYGGLAFGVLGSFPVLEEIPWDLGFQFKYYWSPSSSEATSSGSVTATKINDFSFFTRYRQSPGFAYTAEFGFEYYATDFNPSGASRPDPATSISHKLTNLLVGLEYLF